MVDGDEDALIGHTLGKKFVVRRRLGAGGMGAVYEAEHVLTKRVGALKLLHEHSGQSSLLVQRFLREASAAGRIGSRHIVETIDAGELPDGRPYMFMELLEGTPVSELLKRRGRLHFDEAREIVLQAAAGLSAAHAAGIVHRDVKPENLFLCRTQPPHIKLLDFGISKFEAGAEHRLTAEGTPMGTPYYMSPEQVAGRRDLGPASDMYSLGVVLYECVTGSVPFDAETLPALSIKIFQGDYVPPSNLLSSAAPGLDAVIARMLARAPSERYADMAELRAALMALSTDAPLSLATTLANHAALDETADLHQNTTAPAVTDRPLTLEPSTTPLESVPPTLSREARRGRAVQRLLWGLGGLGLATAVVLARPRSSVPEAPPHPASAAASVSAEAHPEPSAPPPAPAVRPSVTAAVPAPRSFARPAAATSAPAARVSKAARDGLSEQNPFAE
jgi:eukaryotic-like serine/threonine-protein kinase